MDSAHDAAIEAALAALAGAERLVKDQLSRAVAAFNNAINPLHIKLRAAKTILAHMPVIAHKDYPARLPELSDIFALAAAVFDPGKQYVARIKHLAADVAITCVEHFEPHQIDGDVLSTIKVMHQFAADYSITRGLAPSHELARHELFAKMTKALQNCVKINSENIAPSELQRQALQL